MSARYEKKIQSLHREKIRGKIILGLLVTPAKKLVALPTLSPCLKNSNTLWFGQIFLINFSHWENKLRFLMKRHPKIKSEIKNVNAKKSPQRTEDFN
jgi:hypothetical protein